MYSFTYLNPVLIDLLSVCSLSSPALCSCHNNGCNLSVTLMATPILTEPLNLAI